MSNAPAARPPRRGSYRVHDAPVRRLPIPDVKIRCTDQAPGSPARFARPRLLWGMGELSGAVGDLGTFLPHIVGAISVVGMAPSGVLLCFGLFYLVSGLVYGVPMGVQPMKAASAAILIQAMTPAEVAGAGLVIGAFFLLAGASGLVTRLARMIPAALTAGIQLGLGLALAVFGLRLIAEQPWLGLALCLVLAVLLGHQRIPAALVALVGGTAAAGLAGMTPGWPGLEFGWHPPSLIRPGWGDMLRGAEVMVLPQIPLTLTNAIIVTAAVTHQLFPKEQHNVTVRNLALSTGIGNLLATPLGGYLMCHGAGGIAGHYRFGARSATAPLIIGGAFVVLGLFLGPSAMGLFALIPAAVVGSLLLFSGVELAQSARPRSYGGIEQAALLGVAAICVVSNAAVGFAVGLPLLLLVRRVRMRAAGTDKGSIDLAGPARS